MTTDDPELDTPCALVDVDRVDANLRRTVEYCRAHGLAWRPHAKTHKTPALGAAQLQAGAVGLTVATLREAEVMAEVTDDLLLAYPPLGDAKRRRLEALITSGVRLTVALDSRAALQTLATAARSAGREAGVLVELDLGMRRVGVSGADEAVRLARAVAAEPALEYRGVLFYPGHIRRVGGEGERALDELNSELDAVLEALERESLGPAAVSGGSTPTLWSSHRFTGMNEIRPGTNIFYDRNSAAAGVCGWAEIAYSVLATVVSTAVPGQAVIDAGSKSLAREELNGDGEGFGALLDHPEVVVRALSEEHGVLDLSRTRWRPRPGERVRVVPNHVCVSVNLQERLCAVSGDTLVDVWEVTARGRGVVTPRSRWADPPAR